MKTHSEVFLGLTLVAANLSAQTVTNSAATAPASGTAEEVRAAVPLSAETLERIRGMTPLFDGQTLGGWKFSTKGTNTMPLTNAWTVKDGVMASLGAGRGVIYTAGEYDSYRLVFTMRHVSGKPDHQACVLIYCTAPAADGSVLDALGGIQFQLPNGGSWDYRSGKNNDGKGLFKRLPHPKFNAHEWCQVELLVHADGTARMAVAQPPGTKAVEVLDFNDPSAAKKGPIAWQMHNKGLFDEYKDVRIEVEPAEDKLITVE